MSTPAPGTPHETPKARSARRQNLALLGVALLLALLLGGAIAWQHGRFSSLHDVYFLADDVTALTPGTTVRLSGFRVGKVATMQLQPDLKVRVVLSVESEAFEHLRSDARAELVREQLKPAAIDLRAGLSAQPLSAADPRVAFVRRGTLTEVAEDLRARLAPILDNVRQITAHVNERREDLDAVLANSRRLTQELAATAQEMHALSADLRQRVAAMGGQSQATLAEAQRTVARVGTLVGRAEQGLDTVNAKLPALLQRADSTLTQLDAVMKDTHTISASAATEVPTLLRSAPPLVDDTREIVQGLRQSWPVRSLVAPPPPTLLPIDSHDSRVVRDAAAR